MAIVRVDRTKDCRITRLGKKDGGVQRSSLHNSVAYLSTAAPSYFTRVERAHGVDMKETGPPFARGPQAFRVATALLKREQWLKREGTRAL